ncbi:MAG: hypothetical protein RIC55_21140, partial [Pirellulaceae bacterium]
ALKTDGLVTVDETIGVTTTNGDATFFVDSFFDIFSPIDVGTADLRIRAAGDVTQEPAGTVTADELAIRQESAIDGDVLLDDANDVNTLAVSNAFLNGMVTFNDIDDLTIGTVALKTDGLVTVAETIGVTTTNGDATFFVDSFFDITSPIDVGTADLRIRAAGDVTQEPAGTITADELAIRQESTIDGDVLLDDANDVNTLAVSNAFATGMVTFNDIDDLTIGTVALKTDGLVTVDETIGVTTTNGDATFFVDSFFDITSPIDVGTADLRIRAAGDVTQEPAGTITADELAIRQENAIDGDVLLDDDNDVNTLAVSNAFAGGMVTFNDIDDLTIGTVALKTDGLVTVAETIGVATNNGDATFFVDSFFDITSPIDVGTADLRIRAAGDVTQEPAGTITADELAIRQESAAGGDVLLDDDNDVNTLAVANSFATGVAAFHDIDDLTIGAVTAKTDGLVTVATTTGLMTNDGNALLAADGFFAIEQPLNVGAANALVLARGDVTQNLAGSITANEFAIRQQFDDANAGAGVHITLGNPANDVEQFHALNIDNGGSITFVDFDDVTVETVAETTIGLLTFAETTGLSTINSDVTITALGGNLTVARDINAVGIGNILLTAIGGLSDVTLSSMVTSTGGGNVTLRADDDVMFDAAGQIVTSTGNVSVRADAQSAGNGGQIMMLDGSMINAGSGQVDLTADGDITLASAQTTNGGGAAIVINSQSGGLRDGGDTDVDVVANGGTVTIITQTGVGSGGDPDSVANPDVDIEMQIAVLRLDNNVTGDVAIDEVDNISITRLVQLAAGFVDIDAGGTITIAAFGQGVMSTGGGSVILDAEGDLVFGDATLTSVTGAGKIIGFAGPPGGSQQVIVGVGAILQTSTGSIGQKITGIDIQAIDPATGQQVSVDSVGVSTIDQFGNTTLIITLSDPSGRNFRLIIDWGDDQVDNLPGFPDPDRPFSFGTSTIQPPSSTVAQIDANVPLVLEKRYDGNPDPINPRANISISGQIEYDALGEFDNGIQLFENGVLESERIVIPFEFELVVPGAGLFGGAQFVQTELSVTNFEQQTRVESPVVISTPPTATIKQVDDVVTVEEAAETEESLLVLVVVDVQGAEGDPIVLNLELLDGNRLIEMLRNMPNGRYRVKFKPAGGFLQVIFDLIVDQGRLTDVSEQQNQSSGGQGAAVDRGMDQQFVEGLPVDGEGIDGVKLVDAPQADAADPPMAPQEFVEAAQAEADPAEAGAGENSAKPAISATRWRLAAPLAGGAMVLGSLAAGSKRENWKNRVDQALDSGRRSLGKAARLMRRMRK